MRHSAIIVQLSLILALGLWRASPAAGAPSHGLALYGAQDLKYAEDEPYAWVEEDTPQGGTLRLYTIGAFTKLNPFSLKGYPPPAPALPYEMLMEGSSDPDEPFCQYGLLAEKAEVAEDRMSITYWLRKEATFSDGKPVTADDVVFSFNIIHDPEFLPFYKAYYENVREAVKIDEHTVRFEFKETNQELPLIMGQLTILPRHIYGVEGRKFGSDFDDVAVGSGPYVVESFDHSKHITYRRDPDYWGLHLPRNRGKYNFDKIVFKVFLDQIPAREALKGGLVDAAEIFSSKDWALAYGGDYFQKGYMLKETFPHSRVSGMQGFIFNLRKPLFQDRMLRRVIASMMDFEYCNSQLFYNQYKRLLCWWDNNPEMRSRGPAKGNVRDMLIELRRKHGAEHVPAEAILRGPNIVGERLDGSSFDINERMIAANAQLDAMGWVYDREAGVRRKGEAELRFEIMITSPGWSRIVNPFIENLNEIGIRARYRLVQPAEYMRKMTEFDLDMVTDNYRMSESPGNEQRNYWTSAAADVNGSRNVIGIRNPAIDEIVERLIVASSRKGLVEAVQVLDRLLCAGNYLVPQWFSNYDRGVFWNKFGHPDYVSKVDFEDNIVTWWWYDEEKARRLEKAMESGVPFEEGGP